MARRKKKITSSNPLHSKFYAAVAAHRYPVEEGEDIDEDEEPKEEESFESAEQYDTRQRGGYPTPGSLSRREHVNTKLYKWHEKFPQDAASAREAAYWEARAQQFVPPDVIGPSSMDFDEQYQRVRVTKTDIGAARRQQRDQTWNRERGIYRTPSGKRKAPGSFIKDELPPSHRAWLETQLASPNSEFNQGLDITSRAKTGRLTPGQRQRLSRYTDALQQGETHDEALRRVRTTRLKEGVGRPPSSGGVIKDLRTTQAEQVMQPRHAGRQTKFQDVAPTHRGFGVGATAQHIPDMETIKRAFPNASEQDLIQIQQRGTEVISQELLANQKWAHETRRANLMGKMHGKETADTPDKITIFTTNLGYPAVSVPSDSLVGQYIIKKRASILGGYGLPKSQLRGQFPNAVRDAHIIDIATGASIGVKGRQGVFNTTGFRVGKKASPGYGQTRPLGAQVLYDRAGRPLYDAQGNIRYSEGATRPVDWTTPSLGFRVLVG